MTLQYRLLNKGTLLYATLKLALKLALTLVLAQALSLSVNAKTGDEKQPIDVNADRSEYDNNAGIQRLIGNVEIIQGSMKISAEEIAIHLKDNRLARIEGTGTPIRFEQQNDLNETIVGEATSIDYNAIDGTLILSGSARLKQPRQELNSSRIVFNSRAETVKAEGGDQGRVSIRIQPPEPDQ